MRPSLAFTELIALICVRAMAVVQKICCARRALDSLVSRQTRIEAKVPISATQRFGPYRRPRLGLWVILVCLQCKGARPGTPHCGAGSPACIQQSTG